MAACDLIDVIVEDICSAEMGGVGDRCFYGERKWMKEADGTFLRPDENGNLDPDKVVTLLKGHLHKFDFRPKTGQGQGTLDDGADSNNMTFAGRVDKGCDDFRQIDHLARFKDLIYIVKKPGGKFFVYYSPDNKATYASTYDSGQEHNSDHGISFTVTVPGSEYQYLLCDFASATGNDKDPENLVAPKTGGETVAITITTPATTEGTIKVVDANGKIVESGDTVVKDSNITIYSTAKSGKQLDYVQVGTTKYVNPALTVKVTAAVTISAAFETAK